MEENILTDKKRGEKLYTIKEVSDLSGISEQNIIRMVMLKKIKAVRIGKSIRIKQNDFEDFISMMLGSPGAGSDRSSEMDGLPPDVHYEPVLYTAEQVARILNLSVDNIWLLLKSGRLKGFKIREGRS
ncbi:MAG: helix-turn-helix domain-containing protein, partial [Actinobacteria bacterium]|nr:helix-turn-helix domain-containing protein [Actinomycetota bacterium]